MPPSITPALLRLRAALVAETRAFFTARGVLEVDTPLLGRGVVVEAAIDPIPCRARLGPGAPADCFLLASPEAPMKRLLAAGSGPIYQLAKAFRDGEVGRRHAAEFTMLEWYRPGLDHHALMDEVEELVRILLPTAGTGPYLRRTYREVFVEGAGIDPFDASPADVVTACERLGVPVPDGFGRATLDEALDLLLTGYLERGLGHPTPVFVHDYPPTQAALARVQERDGRRVADRFELYVEGIELANGYHELNDPAEQRRRFAAANDERAARGRAALPVDEELLDALDAGLPSCSGVALGFDRLLMLAAHADHIDAVRTLPFSRSAP